MSVSYYCERVSNDFFGEPINAFTNIFFIFTAILILRFYRDYFTFLSISLIGISSFAFHTYSNSFTGILDILAIVLFMIIYVTKIYKSLFAFNYMKSFMIAILFILICFISGSLLKTTILGTSGFYFPIIIHLLFLSIYFNLKKFSQYNLKFLYYSIILFSVSVILRTLDKKICNFFPIGTHFLWHMLNAFFLFYIVKFYVYTETEPPQKNHPNPNANRELP